MLISLVVDYWGTAERSDRERSGRRRSQDPTSSAHASHQTPKNDQEQLNWAAESDHQSTDPGHRADYLGHGGRSQLSVPGVWRLVGVTFRRDDRFGPAAAHRDDPVGELSVLAGGTKRMIMPLRRSFTDTGLVMTMAPGP